MAFFSEHSFDSRPNFLVASYEECMGTSGVRKEEQRVLHSRSNGCKEFAYSQAESCQAGTFFGLPFRFFISK